MEHSNKTKDQLIKELVKAHQKVTRLEAKEKERGEEKDKTQNALRDLQSSFDAAKDFIGNHIKSPLSER